MKKLAVLLVFLSTTLLAQQYLDISQPTLNFLINKNYDKNNDGKIDTLEIVKLYNYEIFEYKNLEFFHQSYFGTSFSRETIKNDLQEISKYIANKRTTIIIEVDYADYINYSAEVFSELQNFEINLYLRFVNAAIIESYQEKQLNVVMEKNSWIQQIILKNSSILRVIRSDNDWNPQYKLEIGEIKVNGEVYLSDAYIHKLEFSKNCVDCKLDLMNCGVPLLNGPLDLTFLDVTVRVFGETDILLVCLDPGKTNFEYIPWDNFDYTDNINIYYECGSKLNFANPTFKNMLLQQNPSIDLNNDGEFFRRELEFVDSLVLNIPKTHWSDVAYGSTMDHLPYFSNLSYLKISDTANLYYPHGGQVDLTLLPQLKELVLEGTFYDLIIPHNQLEKITYKQIWGVNPFFISYKFNSTLYPKLKSIDFDQSLGYGAFFEEIQTFTQLETLKLKSIYYPNFSFKDNDISALQNLKIFDHQVDSIHPEFDIDTLCVNPYAFHNYGASWNVFANLFLTAACGDEITNMENGQLTSLGQALVNATNPVLDLNGDGLITKYELSLAEKIDISNNNLDNIEGIYDLVPNLTHLVLSNNNLDSIDLDKFPNLIYLDISGNNLSDIYFTNNETIEQSGIQLLSQNHSALDTLILNDNQLQSLDVSEFVNLSYLSTLNNLNLETICVNQNQYDNKIQNWNKDVTANYSFACNVITSTQTLFLNNKLYPNPSSDVVYFSNTLIKISTIEGKIVYVNNNQNYTSVNNWKKGIYLAQFNNGQVIKFIVQ